MTIPYRKLHINSSKFKLKSPYTMIADGICVHNTANDAPAINEVNYCRNNNNATSYHIAIDDKEAIEVVPLNRMAFHAGDGLNGKGNRKYIGIEICYSKSGGSRYDNAEANAIKLIATMLHQRKWGIERVKKHQDFSGKYCPHRILDKDNGWTNFLKRVQIELDKLKGNTGDLTMQQYNELKQMIQQLQKELDSKLDAPVQREVGTSHKDAWEWLKVQAITDGSNPQAFLTREQFGTMLKRYHDMK